MKDLYVIYSMKPPLSYKRILLRNVPWKMKQVSFSVEPNFKDFHFWFWNIQLIILGTEKYNSVLTLRLFNFELMFGW